MKNLKNEKAVSPVIGVILMVVITVIIAAILAVFAFGMGGPAKAPEAQLKYVAINTGGTTGSLALTVTNSGGDSLILQNERLSIIDAASGTALANGTMNLWFPGNTYLAPGITLTNTSILAAGFSTGSAPARGNITEIQVLDIPTGQMVSSSKITVQ